MLIVMYITRKGCVTKLCVMQERRYRKCCFCIEIPNITALNIFIFPSPYFTMFQYGIPKYDITDTAISRTCLTFRSKASKIGTSGQRSNHVYNIGNLFLN